MDIDILDYSITKEQGFDDPSLILTHGKADGNTFFVSFNEESTGIRKLLTLIPLVVKSLRLGSILLADDLDNVLHPHLLRFILSLYQDHEKNPHNAQLIFTSHNTAILNPAIMRRDEICLCCRPKERMLFSIHFLLIKRKMASSQEMMKPMVNNIWKDAMVPTPGSDD